MMSSPQGFGSYTLDEVRAIFSLTPQDLTKNILIYGAGASYLAPPAQSNANWVMVDPLYQLDEPALKDLVAAKYQALAVAFKNTPTAFAWHYFASPDQALAAYQKNTMAFLQHFTTGKQIKTYVSGELPHLPFPDNSFDILLCLDSFFINHDQPSLDCYLNTIAEFKRLASDIRIFPLLDKNGQLFTRIGQLMLDLQQQGFGIELKHSQFVLQEQGDAVLKIWPQVCVL